MLDREWRYLYLNEAACRMLALDESAVGTDSRLLHPEAPLSAFGAAYTRVMSGGEPEIVEEHYAPLDSYVRAHVMPLQEAIAIVLWDVTEQRRLENRLKEGRDVYQPILDHVTVGIALRDLAGTFLMINRTGAEMIGRPVEEIVGRTAHDLFAQQDAEGLEQVHREVARTQAVRSMSGPATLEKERRSKVLLQVFPVRNATDELIGTGSVLTDVTQLADLEAELVASQRRYRDVFGSTSLGILLFRMDGHILEANTSVCRMLGYSRHELLTMRGRDLLSTGPEELDLRRAEFLRAGMAGYETEVELVRSDGRMLPVLASVNMLEDPDGDAKLVSVILRDQSALQELQRKLVRAERMEAAGRLAAGVAHDSNNILTALGGYAELLQKEVAGSPSAERHLAGIRRSIERAAEMVSQLLAFTRGQNLQPADIDLRDVVQDLEELLHRLPPPGVDLTVETQPAPALADASQLRQVVLNLVVNAREAVAAGGRVRVSTCVRAVEDDEVLPLGRYAVLTVADDGPGMEDAVARRCFEPFYSTKLAEGGSGLGLSTAHGIARQSGGDLRVTTSPGQGATFELLLPVRTAATADAPPVTDAATTSLGPRPLVVLVAHDDTAVRELVVQALRDQGHRVVEAADGAVALTAGVIPDLLVTDVEMPHMDGPALADAMRTAHPTMAVLFVSGNGDLPDGVSGVLLHKPFTPAALVDAVGAALSRRSP